MIGYFYRSPLIYQLNYRKRKKSNLKFEWTLFAHSVRNTSCLFAFLLSRLLSKFWNAKQRQLESKFGCYFILILYYYIICINFKWKLSFKCALKLLPLTLFKVQNISTLLTLNSKQKFKTCESFLILDWIIFPVNHGCCINWLYKCVKLLHKCEFRRMPEIHDL